MEKAYRFKRVLKNGTFFFSTLQFNDISQVFTFAHETALNDSLGLGIYCVDVYDEDKLLSRFYH